MRLVDQWKRSWQRNCTPWLGSSFRCCGLGFWLLSERWKWRHTSSVGKGLLFPVIERLFISGWSADSLRGGEISGWEALTPTVVPVPQISQLVHYLQSGPFVFVLSPWRCEWRLVSCYDRTAAGLMDIIVPCAEQATVRLGARGMSATVFSCEDALERAAV